MAEGVVCKVCEKNEASEACAVCGIALCELCKRVVQTEDISASHRVKGISTEGVLGPAQKKRVVCPKCMVETDFIEREEHGEVSERAEAEGDVGRRLRSFRMPPKGQCVEKVGDFVVDLTEVCPDIRGREDLVRSILRSDYIETRLRQYDTRIRPFTRAEELAEWDRLLLERYRPLYLQGASASDANGGAEETQRALALASLGEHLSGTGKALVLAREVLEEALRILGPSAPIELGKSIAYPSCNVTVLTGIVPKNLGELNVALQYAEAQFLEQSAVFFQKGGDPLEIEGRTLHLGSLLFLAEEVEELVKICCLGSLSTGNLSVKEMASYPEARTPVGLGTVDRSKPVLAFFGDGILPVFYTVGRLEEERLARTMEIVGLGNAGHELVRLYPAGKILTTTGKALKAVRLGIPDLIVASRNCHPTDLVSHAARVGVPVLAAGAGCSYPVPDRSEEAVPVLVERLRKGESLAVLSVEKAADAVVEYFRGFGPKQARGPDPSVLESARKACTGCDACFYKCPNQLPLGTALKGGDRAAFGRLYDRCLFCGLCEAACPERIPLMDVLLVAGSDKIKQDRFRMRPGRGPLSHLEFRDLTFGLVLGGNGPGMVTLLGCGHYPGSDQDLFEMARELLERNCVVMTAGCGAADVARWIDAETGKAFAEQFPSLATLKGLVNCGGCSADAHIMASMFKFAQLGGGISIKANFDQPADYSLNRAPFAVIIWGPLSDKMLVKAAGFARVGAPVVLGPTGFRYSRVLAGDKYDRGRWTMFDGLTGQVREVDPSPPHLIFPVETKEEAVTMAVKLCFTACALRDPRLSTIDNYTEIHEKYFGDLPDDWTFYLRSPLELHVMKRMRFLKILKDQHGWDVDRTNVRRVRDRDGNLVTMEEYLDRYAIKQGRYATMVKRLVMREAVKE